MKENKNLKRKPEEKVKKKTKGKHKKKILRVLVYIVLVVFMLSLLFLIGYGVHYFSTSSKYNIAKVEFKNNKIYDVQTLTDTAAVPIGENLYKVSKKYIETNLETLTYIEDVSIKRVRPDTIRITVKEYTSKYFAYNHETDKYLRLTNEGIILEQVEGEEKTDDELLVFGISFDDNVQLKTTIAKTELDKLALYEKTNKIYEKSGIEKEITNIEFKDKNIILTLNHDINVILNDEDLDYDINFLKSILLEIEGKAGTIDMTKLDPVFTESIR
ncbi:MAG: FtsQ-type POTRA domain-containing protein [Clostridia bacterium]|nr:FtsQ-type POTRA domain-containing protein [Clostridia bacterium]